jgi:hypothetical protein
MMRMLTGFVRPGYSGDSIILGGSPASRRDGFGRTQPVDQFSNQTLVPAVKICWLSLSDGIPQEAVKIRKIIKDI